MPCPAYAESLEPTLQDEGLAKLLGHGPASNPVTRQSQETVPVSVLRWLSGGDCRRIRSPLGYLAIGDAVSLPLPESSSDSRLTAVMGLLGERWWKLLCLMACGVRTVGRGRAGK